MINICGTEFDLEHPTSIYVNCDCMIGMKYFPDKYFDLAVVDPPYGININNSMGRRKGDKQSEYPKAYWDNTPPSAGYHKNANCRYSDQRDYLDIIYQLIKADMLESDVKECENNGEK